MKKILCLFTLSLGPNIALAMDSSWSPTSSSKTRKDWRATAAQWRKQKNSTRSRKPLVWKKQLNRRSKDFSFKQGCLTRLDEENYSVLQDRTQLPFELSSQTVNYNPWLENLKLERALKYCLEIRSIEKRK